MTARRSVPTRLLLAASLFAGIAAIHPLQAQPVGSYVFSTPAARVAHGSLWRGAIIQRAHFVPPAPDRFDPFPPSRTSADVLPVHHGADIDQPAVKLVPETVHYERAPIGLDDSPTTFGLVARF
ncbi:MAG TPA: hypothetical protein VGL73_04905 [Caulobacteraceae bacterium]|jgi:hypothetical protein